MVSSRVANGVFVGCFTDGCKVWLTALSSFSDGSSGALRLWHGLYDSTRIVVRISWGGSTASTLNPINPKLMPSMPSLLSFLRARFPRGPRLRCAGPPLAPDTLAGAWARFDFRFLEELSCKGLVFTSSFAKRFTMF